MNYTRYFKKQLLMYINFILSSAVTFGLMYCFGYKGRSPSYSFIVDSVACVVLGAFTFFIVMPLVQYWNNLSSE